jgi:hypothetical protein
VEYLSEVSSEKLGEYIRQCLAGKFERSGLVLQDLVNELGRRLDYAVENGRYQGIPSASGHDGLWRGPEGQVLIVEVKTTDAYRISLDTIANYGTRLRNEGTLDTAASILLVVGRQDTGELEAQVRGSRHAWDIRIISAESLVKLVTLKEYSDESETGQKIRSVLTPVEYTRLDRLVDVMFTTATDVEPTLTPSTDTIAPRPVSSIGSSAQPESADGTSYEFTDTALLQAKRDQIVASLGRRFGAPLVRNTRALYWTADHSKRIACTISKRYTRRNAIPYWYAYHPQWDEFLHKDSPTEGYLALGCMDLQSAFAVPRHVIVSLLDRLNTTETDRGTMYWHIHLAEGPSGLELIVPRGANLSLTPYETSLSP